MSTTLKCNRGHVHEGYYCETEDCTKCNEDASCSVVSFLEWNAATCTKTIRAIDSAHLSGFTSKAVAALVHLCDALCVADGGNRPYVEQAIKALLSARSFREDLEAYLPYMEHRLPTDQVAKLIGAKP